MSKVWAVAKLSVLILPRFAVWRSTYLYPRATRTQHERFTRFDTHWEYARASVTRADNRCENMPKYKAFSWRGVGKGCNPELFNLAFGER